MKSQLNSRHKVDATNTLAMSLLRYWFVTVKWTRRELRDLVCVCVCVCGTARLECCF